MSRRPVARLILAACLGCLVVACAARPSASPPARSDERPLRRSARPAKPPGRLVIVEPWETVDLEHEDRKARLERLGRDRLAPEFYSHYVEPDEHGLREFPIRIPVLRVVFDQRVFFDFDRAVLRGEAAPVLDLVAENLRREPPDVALFVAGHTDSKGSEEYNYDLGLRRAESVASALVRRGVQQASVYRVSFGEFVPIAPNSTDAGRARNRRVEFLFGAHRKAVVTWLERQEVGLCPKEAASGTSDCRERLEFEARQLALSRTARRQLAELDRQERVLEGDRTSSAAELAARRSEIQLKRDRVPVTVSRERVPIELRRR